MNCSSTRLVVALALVIVSSATHAISFLTEGSVEEAGRLWASGTLARVGDVEGLSTEDLAGIDALVDFDNDGRVDALLNVSTGGTCCQPEIVVASGTIDNLKLAPVCNDGEQVTVIVEGTVHLLKVKSLAETRYLRFDGNELETVRTVPQLHALSEIEREAPYYIGELTTKTLVYDDGRGGPPAEIACAIDMRYGSLSCAMPLPLGDTQTMPLDCERFGALETMSNGYREFVCNNDTVFWFDGAQWVVRE